MSEYRAPWSKKVKVITYAASLVFGLLFLVLAFIGLTEATGGQPGGWILVAVSVSCCLLVILTTLKAAPRSYRIADSAVVIRQWIGVREIPFSKIASVEIRDSREIFASAVILHSTAGYFGTCATLCGGPLSSFTQITTNDGPLIVLRMNSGDPLVISPENPHDFANELSDRAGVQFEDKEIPAQEISTCRVPFTRFEKVLEIIALVFLSANWALVAYFWSKLPAIIPEHIGTTGVDSWGPKSTIFLSPGVALGTYVLITAITALIYRAKRVVANSRKAGMMVVLVRTLLSAVKCLVLGLMGFTTWQIASIALGKAPNGNVLSTVVLFLSVISGPVMLIVFLIYYSKCQESDS